MSSEQRSFDVVRRGYDIDQVEKFLVMQAEAWSAELDLARGRVAALEEELRRLRAYEAEVDHLRHRAEQLGAEQAEAEQTRSAMLEQANQEALRIRAEAQREAAKLRHDAELARARIEAEARNRTAEQENQARSASNKLVVEAERIRAEAVAEANRLRSETKRLRQEADAEVAAKVDANQGDQTKLLVERRRRLDQDYVEAKAQYDRVVAAMGAKVSELRSTHQALVTGLQAIAKGGLSQLPGADTELPTSLGEDVTPPAPTEATDPLTADPLTASGDLPHTEDPVPERDDDEATGVVDDDEPTAEDSDDPDADLDSGADLDADEGLDDDEVEAVDADRELTDEAEPVAQYDDGDGNGDGDELEVGAADGVDDLAGEGHGPEDVLAPTADHPAIIADDESPPVRRWGPPADQPVAEAQVAPAEEPVDQESEEPAGHHHEPDIDDRVVAETEDGEQVGEPLAWKPRRRTVPDWQGRDQPAGPTQPTGPAAGDDIMLEVDSGTARTEIDEQAGRDRGDGEARARGQRTRFAQTPSPSTPPLPPGMPARGPIHRPPSALPDWSSTSPSAGGATGEAADDEPITLDEADSSDDGELASGGTSGTDDGSDRDEIVGSTPPMPGEEAQSTRFTGGPRLGTPPMPPGPNGAQSHDQAKQSEHGSELDQADQPEQAGVPSLADLPGPEGRTGHGSEEPTAEVPVARFDRWSHHNG